MSEDVVENLESHEPETEVAEDIRPDDPDDNAGEEVSEEPGGQARSEEGEAETPSYQPNFQYRVQDEVREFPEEYRSLVSDEESENRIRELLTRVDGFDLVKDKYGNLKSQHDELSQSYSQYRDFVEAGRHYAKQDLGSLLEMYGVDENQLLRYAQQRLQYQDLPPEQRQQYDMQRENARQTFEMQRELERQRELNAELQKEQFNKEYYAYINHPEVQSVAQKFDQMRGQPGLFDRLVKDRGTAHYHRTNSLLPPSQAITQIYQEVKPIVDAISGGTAVQSQVGAASRPKTIPNMGTGRGHSPAKARPKSIEEMKAQYRERYGAEG